ncbi:hypothetical protein Tco_1030326 [Tanacetum coccineum]|uniref:Uncharacterized protein n=1 Tax=Tanacetum coccineum TaxID=301880 RepID=A0ABQ5G7B9_9ASTR
MHTECRNQVVSRCISNQVFRILVIAEWAKFGSSEYGNGKCCSTRAESDLIKREEMLLITDSVVVAQKKKQEVQLQAEEFDLMAAAAELRRNLRKSMQICILDG